MSGAESCLIQAGLGVAGHYRLEDRAVSESAPQLDQNKAELRKI